MENAQQNEALLDVGLIENAEGGCATVTCNSFGEGVEYVGFMIQVVGATIVAVILVIAFYIFQKNMKSRNDRRI